MEVTVNIDYNVSFYEKLDPDNVRRSHEQLIEKLCTDVERQCRIEAPVRTGYLRDSHYTILNGLESMVCNTAEYTPYVLYGTSRQAPNDYVTRAIHSAITETKTRLLFEDYMRYNGVSLK